MQCVIMIAFIDECTPGQECVLLGAQGTWCDSCKATILANR